MRIETDYLVIGSGIAGLFFAVEAAKYGSVALVTKKERRESNTNYAQGGIAAVILSEDTVAQHRQDTLNAGAGLCKPEIVELGVEEGPNVVQALIDLGTCFSRKATGELSLGREGGHTQPRVVHAEDFTGQEVIRALIAAVENDPRIQVFDHYLALDLYLEKEICRGCWALCNQTGTVAEFAAPMTLLASGGAGQIYQYTTNPAVATGDGIAMAYRAGAQVANLEFIQFHPTMFYHPGGRPFLISEAVRGYGAQLVNHQNEAFVDHAMGALATRDIVSQAIDRELKQSQQECVYLDVTMQDAVKTKERFPNIYQYCLEAGIDMTEEPLPVVPAAHYMCGGVNTDADGATEIAGLYAAGEVACTGFHGANRLASNSLLEGLVFARQALRHALEAKHPMGSKHFPTYLQSEKENVDRAHLDALRQDIRSCMWQHVGIVRTDSGLEEACTHLQVLGEELEELYRQQRIIPALVEARNMALSAKLVARAARMRMESRGGHFNSDHPERDDQCWQHNSVIQATR